MVESWTPDGHETGERPSTKSQGGVYDRKRPLKLFDFQFKDILTPWSFSLQNFKGLDKGEKLYYYYGERKDCLIYHAKVCHIHRLLVL